MAQIPTLEDFQSLRSEIIQNLNELKLIVSNSDSRLTSERRWLRSADVKKMLSISHGTLQKLRDTNGIKFKKLDGVILYDRMEIERMINGNQ